MRKALLGLFILLIATVVLVGSRLGHVNQGQVVAYDQAKGVLTLVQDSDYRDPSNPRFDVLPPVTVAVPEDPSEMGPSPDPGKLLRVDEDARTLMVFDSLTQTIQAIPYTLVEQNQTSAPHGTFPKMDRDRKTITIYAPRNRMLITVSVADQYLNLPADTWRFGDEVRYYYRNPGRAQRLMNVSKTDLASLE